MRPGLKLVMLKLVMSKLVMSMMVVGVALGLAGPGAGVAAADPQVQRSVTWSHGRKIVTETSIEILDDIHFVGPTTRIAGTSYRMLDAVAQTLDGNPSIRKMEVVAYGTDKPGATSVEQIALGAARAKTIMEALVARGVARHRLSYSTNLSPVRPQNPIPVFLILDRAP